MQLPTIGRVAVAVAFLTAGARSADAQFIPDAPTFATMDRQDGTSFIGGQLGITFFDSQFVGGSDGPDVTGLRFDLYGQYVGRNRLGFYGILPISHVVIEDFDDETAIGNVEGGLLYILRTGPGTEFVLHGGLTAPTASDDIGGQESLGGAFANIFSTWPRLTDLAHAWPQTLWARFGISPILQSGQFVLRADLGLDVALASDDAFPEPDPLVRLNVGGGLDTGAVAILGELVTLANTEDDVDNDDDNFVHTFTVSARFRTQTLEPGIAVGLPLDEDVRDFIDLFVIAGVQGRL